MPEIWGRTVYHKNLTNQQSTRNPHLFIDQRIVAVRSISADGGVSVQTREMDGHRQVAGRFGSHRVSRVDLRKERVEQHYRQALIREWIAPSVKSDSGTYSSAISRPMSSKGMNEAGERTVAATR